MKKTGLMAAAALMGSLALTGTGFAQDAPPPVTPEVAYIFNTLLFLIGGFLVMWMAAGFAMLEAGLVRSKNVSMQCIKNISLYSIAGLMYWAVGYSLMYTGVDGGYIGTFAPYGWDIVGLTVAATEDTEAAKAAAAAASAAVQAPLLET
ncbi:MAG: ammonium transporter, partial [Pseudomonadota bacterium]